MTDEERIIFANLLVASGVYNNNVHLMLSTFLFSPTADGKIVTNPIVTANLRLDLGCARQIRDRLIDLLASIDRVQETPIGPPQTGPDRPTDGAPN